MIFVDFDVLIVYLWGVVVVCDWFVSVCKDGLLVISVVFIVEFIGGMWIVEWCEVWCLFVLFWV